MLYVFLIIILLLAALLEGLSLRGGEAYAEADISLSEMRAEPGTELHITTTVRNTGRLPISYLCVRTAYPQPVQLPECASVEKSQQDNVVSEVFRLWGRREKSRGMTVSIEKRGLHKITCREVQRGDFLGLRCSSMPVYDRREVLIYPGRLENAALLEALGTDCGEASAQRWLLRDPVLTMGVREYTGSEPMRTISWSQTARRGELMVREFDYTRSLNCCVLFCTNGLQPGEEELLDKCCSAVRTVCEELAERGVETELFTNAVLMGYGIRSVRSCIASKNKMQDALEILARATSMPGCRTEVLAEASLDRAVEAAACVMIVPRTDTEAEQSARFLQERTGIRPLLVDVEKLEEQ